MTWIKYRARYTFGDGDWHYIEITGFDPEQYIKEFLQGNHAGPYFLGFEYTTMNYPPKEILEQHIYQLSLNIQLSTATKERYLVVMKEKYS